MMRLVTGYLRGRAVSAVAVLATLALLCGCGSSDTTAKFKSGYNALRGPLNQTGDQLAAEINLAPKQTDAQVEQSFRGIAQRFQGQVSELQKLKPPASVAADWNNVLAAASRMEADLNAIASAAATHSATAAKQAGDNLVKDAQELTTAATPVKNKLGLK